MFSIQQLSIVLIGGGLGSVCRYIATTLIGSIGGTVFPFGTLFVNFTGSFLMGFLMFFFLDEHFTLPETLRLFLAVGFLGGFTTFSSFSMEFWLLFERGQAGQAAAYVLASVAGGILACGLGMLLIRQLPA